jgi:hypothetical protein
VGCNDDRQTQEAGFDLHLTEPADADQLVSSLTMREVRWACAADPCATRLANCSQRAHCVRGCPYQPRSYRNVQISAAQQRVQETSETHTEGEALGQARKETNRHNPAVVQPVDGRHRSSEPRVPTDSRSGSVALRWYAHCGWSGTGFRQRVAARGILTRWLRGTSCSSRADPFVTARCTRSSMFRSSLERAGWGRLPPDIVDFCVGARSRASAPGHAPARTISAWAFAMAA